ncbi:hypothetical protein BC834DRAFT_553513 [Gloeopeniophorella convolvens]|nr:hypothetical protein BC834DRAFT_553513 [Gloeopeniophorella convolvens]
MEIFTPLGSLRSTCWLTWRGFPPNVLWSCFKKSRSSALLLAATSSDAGSVVWVKYCRASCACGEGIAGSWEGCDMVVLVIPCSGFWCEEISAMRRFICTGCTGSSRPPSFTEDWHSVRAPVRVSGVSGAWPCRGSFCFIELSPEVGLSRTTLFGHMQPTIVAYVKWISFPRYYCPWWRPPAFFNVSSLKAMNRSPVLQAPGPVVSLPRRLRSPHGTWTLYNSHPRGLHHALSSCRLRSSKCVSDWYTSRVRYTDAGRL